MSTKLRLQRQGRKKVPYYQIVVADARAPRDGRFIERIGNYNPNTNPATINLDFDRAVSWLQKGAEPTDTVRAILSYKGALHKNHLLNGVAKGAFTAEEAEAKFGQWMEKTHGRIEAKVDRLALAREQKAEETLKRETQIREERQRKIDAKYKVEAGEVETEITETAAGIEEVPQSEEAPLSPENEATVPAEVVAVGETDLVSAEEEVVSAEEEVVSAEEEVVSAEEEVVTAEEVAVTAEEEAGTEEEKVAAATETPEEAGEEKKADTPE